MKQQNKLALVLVSAALATACSAPIAERTVMMPANETGMNEVKRVAVMPFDTENGNKMAVDVTEKFEDHLASLTVNGEPRFKLVKQSTMDESSGADTLFFGRYEVSDTQAQLFRQTRSRCKRLNGDVCVGHESYEVACTRYSVTAKLTAKAVNAETGQVRYSKPYYATSRTSECPDANADRMTDKQLADSALASIFKYVEKDVAPYNVDLSLEFMDGDNMNVSNSVAQARDAGIQWAKEGRLDLACRKFKDVIENVQSPANLYNAAVCAEIEGDLSKAKSYYKLADEMQYEQNHQYDLITKAVNRIGTSDKGDKKGSLNGEYNNAITQVGF